MANPLDPLDPVNLAAIAVHLVAGLARGSHAPLFP